MNGLRFQSAVAIAVVLCAGCTDDQPPVTALTSESGWDPANTVPTDADGLLDWIDDRTNRPGRISNTESVAVTLVWGDPPEESRIEVEVPSHGDADGTFGAYCPSSWSSSSLNIAAVDRTASGTDLAGVDIQVTRLPLSAEPGTGELGPPSSMGRALIQLVTADGRTAIAEVQVALSEEDRSGTLDGPDRLGPDRSFTGHFRCG